MDNSATYLLLNSTLTESNYDSSMSLNRLPEGNLDSLIDKSEINKVLILQWRDLEDADAGGSEVHSHNIAEIWASKGLNITFRTSAVENSSKSIPRSGYTSIRSGGRFGVFASAPTDVLLRRLGKFDALVEIWNGVPFMTPYSFPSPSTRPTLEYCTPKTFSRFRTVPRAKDLPKFLSFNPNSDSV